MNIEEDYNSFLKESLSLLNELNEHETMTFDLFLPVLMTLQHIKSNNFMIGDLTKEETTQLFSEGYYFLYNSYNFLKQMLKDVFGGDIEELVKFDKNVYLLLRLNETELDSSIAENIYDLSKNQVVVSDKYLDDISNKIENYFIKNDEYSTTDRFADILDALGIGLI